MKTVDRTSAGQEPESLWGMMLRDHSAPFCDYAHETMGHYGPAVNRRWFREYPYSVLEIDGLLREDAPEPE